jgi:mono/diheme cytochrome c family protein/glucose/arabinose dehydrogenase
MSTNIETDATLQSYILGVLIIKPAFRLLILFASCFYLGLIMAGCSEIESERPSGLPLFANEEAAQAHAEKPGPEAPDYSLYAHLKVPPLSPEETLELFELEDGFRIELVAHEPDIIDPVALDIDRDGRLWVIEMPSYMPVHDKEDRETSDKERIPKSRIVVLEDTNGDGRMDQSHVFMDGLVLPRAIKVMDQGVLFAEPPNVWFIRDTTGNGVGDTRELVYDSYGDPETDNVEHMPNGLFWGMDNWIHSAHSGVESLRYLDGKWKERHFEDLHQWGMTQDDWGRLYSSHNTRTLTTHLSPYGYSSRHPDMNLQRGIYRNIAESETMWPAHPTGVNRGYRIENEVRQDGTLKRSTSTTGPVIYRGDQFGEEYRGNAFVPEPSGNLIKRLVGLDDAPGEIDAEARFAYREKEFLTSTDERFRPVNMYNAPDGSLYVIDMYRGLFQHARFLTDFLREYSVEHGLHKPEGLGKYGRIYRIVRDDREIDYNTPKMSNMNPVELAGYLTHQNGLLRDNAQQLLVQRSPDEAISTLEGFITDPNQPFYTRLQALWTLDGYSRQSYPRNRTAGLALEALNDPHPRIRAAAIRILEPEIISKSESVLQRLDQLIETETEPYTRLQLLASLGELETAESLQMIARILNGHSDDRYFLEMGLSGVYRQENKLLGVLISDYGWEHGVHEQTDWFLNRLTEISFTENGPAARLDGEALELFNQGEQLYRTCLACHGGQGQGMEGVATPLAGSDWVTGEPGPLIRITLHGFEGGAEELGYKISGVMPQHNFLSDEEVAAVLTYIRQSWGNDASPVSAGQVEEIRAATEGRTDTWTPGELQRLPE